MCRGWLGPQELGRNIGTEINRPPSLLGSQHRAKECEGGGQAQRIVQGPGLPLLPPPPKPHEVASLNLVPVPICFCFELSI